MQESENKSIYMNKIDVYQRAKILSNKNTPVEMQLLILEDSNFSEIINNLEEHEI